MITEKKDKRSQIIDPYISIPSETHVYSLGIEYIRNWVLDKFDPEYFKTVYVNGKHIFDDYRRFNRERLTKGILKPALNISPAVDVSYDRERVDLLLGGRTLASRPSRYFQDAMIQDRENNIYLSMDMKQVQMNFAIRIRVESRAQQLDLYNFMKIAFRVGATQGENVSYDYHIPKEIMINIASAAGFEVIKEHNKEGALIDIRPRDMIGFLSYCNSNSIFPIIYKMRNINGNSEYFVRLPELYTHISNLDELNIDDGDRVDQTDSNYHIEMNVILKIPAPQTYTYYSSEPVERHKLSLKSLAGLYQFRNIVSPVKDENGWPQYMSTGYIDDERDYHEIPMQEFFMDSTNFNTADDNLKPDIVRVIERTKDTFLSPSLFINFKTYNGNTEISCKMDWETWTLKLDYDEKELKYDQTDITIYVDMEYMNSQMLLIREADKTRLK